MSVGKKNILVSALSLKVGGGEVMAMKLASELTEHFNVYLFYHYEHLVDPALVKSILPPAVKVISLNDFPWLNLVSWKINALLKRFSGSDWFHEMVKDRVLRYYIKKHEIHLINSHSKYSDAGCLRAVQKQKVPLVITEHGEYTQSLLYGEDDNLALSLNKASYIITVSEFNQQMLKSQCQGLLVPMQTIYNGIRLVKKEYPLNARQQLRIPPTAFVYGMVSRGIKKKGWQQAIDAFFEVQESTDKAIYLVLVGGGMYIEDLKQKYRSVANIIFTGETAEPAFYIDAFDIGLLPTQFKTESLPLTVIEYLYLSKPVIATKVVGIPEILTYNGMEMGKMVDLTESGIVDVKQMAMAMLNYLNDTELYQTHVANAAITEHRFSLTVCADLYRQVFEKLFDKY